MTDTEKKNALALKLFVTEDIKKAILLGIDDNLNSLGAQLGQMGKELSSEISIQMRANFMLHGDALMKEMAMAVAEMFELEDLEALDTFYASPTGQKLLKKMPELNARLGEIGNTFGDRMAQVSEETLAKILN